MNKSHIMEWAGAILVLTASANAATTFVPGILKHEIYYATSTRVPTGGGPGRGVSIISDALKPEGTVLATLAPESGAPDNAVMIAEFPAGVTLTHDGGAGSSVLGGKRLIFLSGTREFDGGSGDTAGFFDLTPDGAKMFINAVKYMAGAGKTNVLFVSPHAADNAPTTGAAGNGFTVAADKGYTDLLKANGFSVTRLVQTPTPNAATVNTYDLVIVGRGNASGNFQNASADNWNTLTAPMILMSGYHLRQNRLGFFSGNTIPDAGNGVNLKLVAYNAAHPVFSGVNLNNPFVTYPIVYRPYATNTVRSVSYPNAWDLGGASYDNYTSISRGLISVNQTGDYDIIVAADDDTDVYLSTDTNPANKRLVAQEPSYSSRRNWITAGAGNAQQKSSATWGLGVYGNGIRLNANTQYYLEVVHHNGSGGDQMGVTLVPHGTAPTDGDATTLTNGTSMYGFTTTIGINITTPTNLTITAHPSNKTVYASMAAVFRVAATTDSETGASYQWRRNGTPIPGATGPSYTLMASTNDTGAVFDCVVKTPDVASPVLTQTSGSATLTVQPLSGATIVQGQLKRELITNQTANVVANLDAGNMRAPDTVAGFAVLDLATPGANVAERVSGFFTPSASGPYIFFLASDDDTRMYLSTDDQPKNKRLIAVEDGWSTNRNWLTIGGNGSLPAQKRSDQWVPDPNNPPATPPHASGIQLTAGQRYYIELLHRNAGGGNGLSATVVTAATAANVLDGDATTLANNVLSYATSPVTVFAITNQPKNTQVFEAASFTLVVGVNTDSEITPSYQWKKNGQVVANATSATFTATAALADNNALYTCEISLPGQTTLVSQQAKLTVNQASFAAGLVKREIWLNDTTVTRAIVGANVPGTFPPADVIAYVPGFDVGGYGDHYIQRLSGFFVPPATGLYVFWLTSDDDGDLYLSTNDQPSNKRLIARETGYSNQRNWNTIGGGTSTLEQKRSDQFTPDGGLTYPGNPNFAGGLQLTAGNRYYIEVVHHENTGGDQCGVTYGRYDPLTGAVTNAPVNGDASRLTGTAVGVLIPTPSVLEFTNSPQSVAVPDFTFPVYFSAGATSDVAQPYLQWRKNEENIPGANGTTYGFMTSRSDSNTRIDVVATLATLVKTSAVANVTFQSNAIFVPNALAQEFWGPNNTAFTRNAIESFTAGPALTNRTIQGSFESPVGQADNFVERVRGFFTPAVTTNYVFFVNADDDADLFLSTNDEPKNKRLIAQEVNWSDPRNWLNVGTGTAVSQKRSDQWSPDGGMTMPYNEGIWLTNGQRYYIEAVHHEGASGDNLGVTFKMGLDPSNDPTNSQPSVLTGSLIGYLAAPASSINPVLTINQSNGSVTVSWTPAGGTLKSSTDVGAPMNTWNTLSTTNPAIIPVGGGSLFMRVQQ